MRLCKKHLSAQRSRFLELLQKANFCQIRNLRLVEGEPVVDQTLQVIQDLKIGGDNSPRPEAQMGDFALRAEILELFVVFDTVKNGTILQIDVRHGLPCRALVSLPVGKH